MRHCWFACVAMFLVLMLLAGCDDEQPRTADIAYSTADDLSAQEILGAALQRYSQAHSYQDNAVLYLTYRLNGRAIQEPHPWSIAWNRKGQFSADWFNAKLRCDGNRFSCYVYDIETGNIDNQQILVPSGGDVIRKLFDDRIASHFIFGTSELPLDKLETERENQLIQPMLSFYDEQFSRKWLENPTQISRLSDDDSTGRACYVLRMEDEGKIYRLWIARDSGVIEQIEWPLQYLDSQVLASDEITNLQFFVRFHDAQLNSTVPPARFEIQQQLAAKLVTNFVALPEPMTSELIGEVVEEFEFFTPDSTRVTGQSMSGSRHILLCITGYNALEHVRQFAALKKQLGSGQAEFDVVYSDEFLESPRTGSYEIAEEYRDEFNNSGLNLLYDREMNASASFKLKVVPSVLVVGGNGVLEYARAIDSDDWQEQLQTVVQRIAAGEAVAEEMKSEYRKFLDEYHDQLAAASSNLNIAGSESRSSVRNYEAERVWEMESLQEPGNVHVPLNSNRIFVLDGWQTVVELDVNGQIQNKHRLPVPADTAINRIRSFRDSHGNLMFVAFAMLGKQAFVFDNNWKLVLEYPSRGTETVPRGITECQLADTDADGITELWISFVDENGVQKVDINTAAVEQVAKQPVKSFCLIDGRLIRVVNDSIMAGSQASGLDELRQWRISMIRRFGKQIVATGRNDLNHWKLFKLDSRQLSWSKHIGSQVFDTDIDPLTAANNGQQALIGIATGRGPIIFADGGNHPIEYSMSGLASDGLTGIGILACEGKTAVIVSADGAVSLWELSGQETVVRPASTTRRR